MLSTIVALVAVSAWCFLATDTDAKTKTENPAATVADVDKPDPTVSSGSIAADTDEPPEVTEPETAAETESGGETQLAPADVVQPLADSAPTENARQDKYNTDPVPAEKPQPAEPQETKVDQKKEYICTLYIECGKILENLDKLNPAKTGIVPADGVVYAKRQTVFYEGESVFDLLKRETRNSGIHMEFNEVPAYNSAYIEGIANLYEFDCGELSGWTYSVNGWFPNYGVSRYQLAEGDSVELHYTCDLGHDFGLNF
jgi:hypothetical protein